MAIYSLDEQVRERETLVTELLRKLNHERVQLALQRNLIEAVPPPVGEAEEIPTLEEATQEVPSGLETIEQQIQGILEVQESMIQELGTIRETLVEVCHAVKDLTTTLQARQASPSATGGSPRWEARGQLLRIAAAAPSPVPDLPFYERPSGTRRSTNELVRQILVSFSMNRGHSLPANAALKKDCTTGTWVGTRTKKEHQYPPAVLQAFRNALVDRMQDWIGIRPRVEECPKGRYSMYLE